ncbi:Sds3-like-domain-containing protein [Pyrenochaeta sp. MPI-SDFR-AT-0127]|nr:Sds3-like-domain-containing protein [Pyrenochaeta sp. MPI-SDFR-AT-0127]
MQAPTPAATHADDTAGAVPMLSAISAPSMVLAQTLAVDAPPSDLDDMADSRSSSLSELGDASDDQSEPTPRPTTAIDVDDEDEDDEDEDSEAETERLDNTPRKLTRTATNTSLLSEAMYTRTPSKLAHARTIEQDGSSPPTPSVMTDDATFDEAAETENPLHSLSLAAASQAASLEYAGKKRKRTSSERSPVDQDDDEPARKRSGTVPTLNGLAEGVADSSEQVDVDEELENAEERLSQLAQEELDLEERQANIAAETVNEMATVAKHTKPRKGGRRGKRKVEDTNYGHGEQLVGLEAPDVEVEGEADELDSAALDEEVSKKKIAIDELAKIEKKFKLFREKLCDEQIAQFERELEMLKQPNCVHPEYLAMIKCVDERRSDKIAYESRLLEYKQKNLDIITTAERHQMHSQYFQTVRHVREDTLEECNQRVFELQRGRRQLGCDEIEYMIKLPEKRSDQIKHQTAYNLEVSILSGVAKYVGFPAAPDISAARSAEIDEDFRAMKIATRAPAPPPSFRTYNRTTTADEAAAEEQFLESTPWANPRHPSHQETRYSSGPSHVPSYQTPAGQRRVIDLTAPNGSASTIEATSNPPSSTAQNINGRLGESESPVLQMKRPPNDHSSYRNTPSSNAQNLGVLGRESYGMFSSPATQPEEQEGQSWTGGSMRPHNTGSTTASSGPPGSGRPDASRVPLSQRNGLGTVSVGSGLFGR